MKIRPVAVELFHADRRTDMMKLTDPYRNFANAPKKGHGLFIHDKYADIMRLWRDAIVNRISLLSST